MYENIAWLVKYFCGIADLVMVIIIVHGKYNCLKTKYKSIPYDFSNRGAVFLPNGM
jgi:hypothetical protein